MAISTYAELKTALAAWAARSNLTARLDDFVTLAESRIYYGAHEGPFASRPLRLLDMQTRETPTLTNGAFSVASNWIETVRLAYVTGSQYATLDYVSPEAFEAYEGSTATPCVYTVLNGAFQIRGTTGTIQHDYVKRFDAMSADSDSNVILTRHPGLYLWGSLVEMALYQKDLEEAQRAHGMYVSVLTGANRTLASGTLSSLRMRVR